MPYFMACVNGTLRVSPFTPVTLPRIVSNEGLILNNPFIPPGTEVGANPYVINRDQNVFGMDADEFNPERWLEDPERAKHMHKWFFTWGGGPRDCVGRPFARILITKNVASGTFRYCWLSRILCSLLLAMQLFKDCHIERLSDEEGRGRGNDRGLCIYSGQWLIFKERSAQSSHK